MTREQIELEVLQFCIFMGICIMLLIAAVSLMGFILIEAGGPEVIWPVMGV